MEQIGNLPGVLSRVLIMKDPKGKIKSFGPQTLNKGQLVKSLELGNDEMKWRMGWREEAWRSGDHWEAVVEI